MMLRKKRVYFERNAGTDPFRCGEEQGCFLASAGQKTVFDHLYYKLNISKKSKIPPMPTRRRNSDGQHESRCRYGLYTAYNAKSAHPYKNAEKVVEER